MKIFNQLAKPLIRKTINAQRGFRQIITREQWVIISACKKELTDQENEDQTDFLEAILENKGYDYYPVTGHYDRAKEKSFLVFGISEKFALQVARYFNQESILIKEGLVFVSDRTIFLSNLSEIELNGDQEDNFSIICWQGEDIKFSVPIDFNHKIESWFFDSLTR